MNLIIQKLIYRFRHLLEEISRFAGVGAVAFAFDITIFNLTLHLGWFSATLLSTTVATTVAFVGNRLWTWRHRRRTGIAREYGLYFFFTAVGLGIAIGVLWFSHEVLGSQWPVFQTRIADNVAKLFFGTALATSFKFWAYRTIVFPAQRVAPIPVPVSGD